MNNTAVKASFHMGTNNNHRSGAVMDKPRKGIFKFFVFAGSEFGSHE